MKKIIKILLLTCLFSTGFAREVPSLSAKGIEAFKEGKYSSARKLLTKALEKSLLSARDDWVVKATLNLAEVEMAAGHYPQVAQLLESLPLKVDPYLKGLILWKRGQNRYYQGEHERAIENMQAALELCGGKKKKPSYCHNIHLDLFRAQLHIGVYDSVKQSYEEYKSSVPKKKYPTLYVNDALVLMQGKQYIEASLMWEKAVKVHREKGRMVRMAACLNKLALSQFMEGRIELARETNKKAESVLLVMGLKLPALNVALLNLILYHNTEKWGEQVDKLKVNLDFVGLSFGDINGHRTIKNYYKMAVLDMPDDFSFPGP